MVNYMNYSNWICVCNVEWCSKHFIPKVKYTNSRSICGQADSVMDSHTTGQWFKTRWVRYTSYKAPDYHSIIDLSFSWCVWKVREGFLHRVWLIKMGSCVFQCDILHQWIAQQVGPKFVYCDEVRCHVLCLWRGIHVWQHIGQKYHCTVAIWPWDI